MAFNWMVDTLGASTQLSVQIAWGADLLGDPTAWSWTEIGTDVRESPGISISLGRGDEAGTAQPASCSFELDNRSGDYSLGGQSANWPNVRLGTPVRVRVNPAGAGMVVTFQGAITSLGPTWPFHSVAQVTLESAGTLRRLAQGDAPLESAHLRGTRGIPTVLHYWPMEDGKSAAFFAPAVGDVPLVWTGNDIIAQLGSPRMGEDTAFATSAPLPVVDGAWYIAYVAPYVAGSEFQATMLAHWGTDLEASEASIIGFQCTGTATYIDLMYTGDGSVYALVRDAAHGSHASPTLDVDLHSDPRTVRMHLQLTQVGADVDISFGVARTDDSAVASTYTLAGHAFGNVERVFTNATNLGGGPGIIQNAAFGHLVVRTDVTSLFEEINLVSGWNGETTTERVQRLCDENDEIIEVTHASFTTLGPQSVDSLLGLLHEAEIADQGLLYDGRGPGLIYSPREERENRPADLTLDATDSNLKPALTPVYDDQRARNKVTITRKGASPVTFEDVTGPMGTAEIGTYDDGDTVNVKDDNAARHYAEWSVWLGTQEGYRYPTITVDLGSTPSIVDEVLALGPGSRVDITGLDDALASHPGPDTLSLLVEGIDHTLQAGRWGVVLKCSLYAPWRIGTLWTGVDSTIIVLQTAVPGVADNASVTASVPAASLYQPDDLLVIVASIRNSGTGTVDTPAGWEIIKASGNVSVFGKLADYGEEDVTVSFAGGAAGATCIAQMFSVRGTAARRVGIAASIHTSAAQLNGSAQNIAYPALTITQDNCAVLVVGWKQDDWTSVAQLAGMTEILDSPSVVGSDAGMVADYVVQSTATNLASGSLVVTGGANAISRGVSIAFLPDPSPPPLAILDTQGSTLNGALSAAGTSISVTTTVGPLWTTAAADYPIDLDIGGVKITATACADATSPQTMTISAAPIARSSGVPVKLWDPPVLSR